MAYGLFYDYLNGYCIDAFKYLGHHFETRDGVKGVVFRLYAPLAEDVSVIGDFNSWNIYASKMNKIDEAGLYELFIPGVNEYQSYKFHFRNAKGKYVDKIDPFAFFSELRPQSCSRTFDIEGFPWDDYFYMNKRDRNFSSPMAIYECHLGSFKGKDGERFFSYEEMADSLIPYLKEMGYTHIELLPIVQHPFDGSWGYQATGFYSADSRYGNPKQLMSFVNRMHQENIGVIVDFAPVHFASDNYALKNYDGSPLYEYSNPKMRISSWGSRQFDLGKDPVRSFLISAMNYFATYFHIDGIRVDAVSNIIYPDGDSSKGINQVAIEFTKRMNSLLHNRHSSLMMIAEDSSSFYGVTKPLEYGGLGFDYKWDLGWMNDTLKYYSLDPIYKKWDHNKLTFSMAYFYNENFLLPLSHDEVVHLKGSLINKMHGTYEEKFALLRNLIAYQYGHPGKKLSFMGNEIASFDEWNEKKSLPWEVLNYPLHQGYKRMVRDLNLIYRHEKAMHLDEYNPSSFSWTMVDNNSQSVFAFIRKNQDETLLFVYNMTPVFYEEYDVGVEENCVYEEIFNSDKAVYGGADQYNGLPLTVHKGGPENRPYYIKIKLGSFAAMIFKKKKKSRK